jgi:monothiol glutaredoxin
MSSTEEKIKKQIAENPIILYMKGTPDMPSCGFSAKASAALKSTGIGFAYVNVLESPFIMERLPNVTDFPTFPQLIIKGEIIGGSDIVEEMLANGELLPMLQEASS